MPLLLILSTTDDSCFHIKTFSWFPIDAFLLLLPVIFKCFRDLGRAIWPPWPHGSVTRGHLSLTSGSPHVHVPPPTWHPIMCLHIHMGSVNLARVKKIFTHLCDREKHPSLCSNKCDLLFQILHVWMMCQMAGMLCDIDSSTQLFTRHSNVASV